MSVRNTTSKLGPIKKGKSTTSRKDTPYVNTNSFSEVNKTKTGILSVKRSMFENVTKIMSNVSDKNIANEYYSLNRQLDLLLNPRTSKGDFSTKIPNNEVLHRKLWDVHLAANNIIINYSPQTDINFFPRREGVTVNNNDILILFLNVHGAKLNGNDARMLGKFEDMNYCETSLTCHGSSRYASPTSIEQQRITCSRVARQIICDDGFCSQYIDKIQEGREEILRTMASTKGTDGEKAHRMKFYNDVEMSCPTYVTSRCNHCVNNKRYSYKSNENPNMFNMIVLTDSSGNMTEGQSLLDYTRGAESVTFTTQDIINQAYAIGYRNVGIVSGACLDYTNVCTEEINRRASELSREPISSRYLIETSSVKRGGIAIKKSKKLNRRKNKTSKRKKRYHKHSLRKY
jgi:hypothetical protein